MGIVADDGRLLVATDPARRAGDEADRSFFQRALQTRRFAVGRYALEEGRPAVRVGHPVIDPGGAVKAVLFATVDLSSLHTVLHRIELPGSSVVLVLDEGGRVLARFPDPSHDPGMDAAGSFAPARRLAVPDAGSVSVTGPDGVARRFGFTSLRSGGDATGATVAVGIPERTATAAAEADLLHSALLVAAVAAAALLASWLFGNYFIMDRVNGLLHATRRLSTGELRARRGARRGASGELGQLEKAFDEMALSLELRTHELRRAEARYRELVEAMPAVFYVAGAGGTGGVDYVSPQVRELTGFAPEEWLSRPGLWREQVDPADLDRVAGEMGQALAAGGSFQVEYRIRARDGSVVWVRDHGTGEESPAGAGRRIRGFMVNVTDRKVLEQQFLQAQKMEALGRLSASVAHDFNNLLTVIAGYSQLLQARLSAEPPVQVQLEEIVRAADRATVLTRQLLHFSRRQGSDPVVLDLNEALGALDRMIRRLIGDRITVETGPARGLWKVRVDRGHVDQVIMNLVVNARDAMPDGGTLTLRTENAVVGGEEARRRLGAVPGEFVCLTVADTGCGMDEATRERIFEPFFTTKGEGKGTGLGLSTVYGIVRGAGGFVEVQSEPGRGTAFRIHLPRHEGVAPSSGAARESARGRAPSRREAATAEEARRAMAGDGGAFDLLLVDVSLPDGDGGKLVRELTAGARRPRAIVMSGYSPSLLHEEGKESGGFLFLQKPFRPAELREAMARVLG